MTKDFYARFGIKMDIEDAKRKFIARADVAIIKWVESIGLWGTSFLKWLSEELGEDWHTHIYYNKYEHANVISSSVTLSGIINKDFMRCLQILELIYKYLSTEPRYIADTKLNIKKLDGKVRNLLEKSEVDLGVFCKDGKFYPSGAKFLDKELVEDALDWLNNYPKEKKDFEKALKALMEKRCDDVLSNCYNCVEGMAKGLLNNNKGLRANKKDLLEKLGLSKEWGSFLANFISYADEYKRHASKKRHQENPNEVEAFLYLTGLVVRLCIKSV